MLPRLPRVEPPFHFTNLSLSGSVFSGKFATSDAQNSRRRFIADYYGDIRILFFRNQKISCEWSLRGNFTQEGVYRLLDAGSTLCSGKLQQDGTFEFQGAYLLKDTQTSSGILLGGENAETFTLRGTLGNGSAIGDIVMGSLFGNLPVPETPPPDTTQGVRFEAVDADEP